MIPIQVGQNSAAPAGSPSIDKSAGPVGNRPRVVVTGADGFVGWHTRVRLRALWDVDVVPVSRATFASGALEEAVRGADAVIHAAGVIRGTDEDVEQGNLALAEAVVEALDRSGSQAAVVYANSVHAGSDSGYGRGKQAAAEVFAKWGRRRGSRWPTCTSPTSSASMAGRTTTPSWPRSRTAWRRA